MKRPALNLLVDSLAAAGFLGLVATGYLLHFPLPPGTNKSLTLWGLTRHHWGAVHAWISVVLLTALLVHVALHWQWVVSMVARQLGTSVKPQGPHRRSGLLTAAGVLGALALFAWAAETSVRERPSPYANSDRDSTTAAENSKSGAANPGATVASVSAWSDVYPVLERSCRACHGPERASGGFRVDRPEDYLDPSRSPPLVVAGHSEASALVAIVSGQRQDIPLQNRHRLPDQDVVQLKQWIDAGAVFSAAPETRSQQPLAQEKAMKMELTSTAFAEEQPIPETYTGDGRNVSPPLRWSDPPAGTHSFALVCEDPDAPRGTWTHWVLFNIPAETRELREAVSARSGLPKGAVQGTNDFGKLGYGGPAPPPGKPHRYFFKLYALDRDLNLPAGTRRADLLAAMKPFVLAEGQLMGTYSR